LELFDLSSVRGRAQRLSDGATMGALYPTGASSTPGSLVALDVLEVEPGSSTPGMTTPEEHFLCVMSGTGEIKGGTDGPEAHLRPGSVIHVAPRETHTLTASGRETLRVLVVTPLLVLSDRALGVATEALSQPTEPTPPAERTETPRERLYVAETPASRTEPTPQREEPAAPTPPLQRNTTPAPAKVEEDDDGPRPDLSQVGGLRKASELAGQPKPERRRPAPLPEPEPVPEPTPQPDAD